MKIQIQCKNCGAYKRTDTDEIPKGREWAVMCIRCKGIINIIIEKE